MKNFALIGAGGFVAPRHMQAIKETGNQLLAALDINDSVGILDSYFPEAHFFTEFERFDRHVEKLRKTDQKIDFISVCTPNYLHDAHIRFGLRIGATVICEKPVVLNPWNVNALIDLENETGHKVYSILQLRLHPSIMALKKKLDASSVSVKHKVKLRYVSARGNWYHSSWKGEVSKSGGISTNLGIHFFDMLLWLFGNVEKNTLTHENQHSAKGILELEKATVDWFLSIEARDLPPAIQQQNKRTYRNLEIDGESFDFSEGFENLHTQSYNEILSGKGFPLIETLNAIHLVHRLRTLKNGIK